VIIKKILDLKFKSSYANELKGKKYNKRKDKRPNYYMKLN